MLYFIHKGCEDIMKEEKKTTKKKTTTAKKGNTSSKSATTKKKTTSTNKKTTTTGSKKTTTARKTPAKTKVVSSKVVEPVQESKVEKEEVVKELIVQEPEKKEVAFDSRQFALRTFAVILAAILVVVILVVYFIQVKNNTYSVDWERKSYLVENDIASTNCESVSNAILGDYNFVFVRPKESNEDEFNLEKKLLKVIKDYNLEGHFYVYTLDNTCGVITDPYSVLGQNLKLDEGIEKVPTILYYKDGELVDYIQRDDEQMMSDADFVKLLDIYEFEK